MRSNFKPADSPAAADAARDAARDLAYYFRSNTYRRELRRQREGGYGHAANLAALPLSAGRFPRADRELTPR